MRIYKFELKPEPCDTCGDDGIFNATVSMPLNSQIIKVKSLGLLFRNLTLWAMVDHDFIDGGPVASRDRYFKIYGTGRDFYIANEEGLLRYIDTVFDEPYVWHVFELEKRHG